MAIAKKVDRLYTILTDASVMDEGLLISLKAPTLTMLWHYRLGHLHHQALLKMSSNELVSGLPALEAKLNNWSMRCLFKWKADLNAIQASSIAYVRST